MVFNGVEDVVFHDEATVASNGDPLLVGAYKTLTIEIFGTSTGRTVSFYSKGPSGALVPLLGTRISAAPVLMAVSTTGTGETWQFDITGLENVIMDLTAITDNNVSIKGRAVF